MQQKTRGPAPGVGGVRVDEEYTSRVQSALKTQADKLVPTADATRLSGLQFAQSIVEAKQSALAQERARVALKYGDESADVQRADARLNYGIEAATVVRAQVERGQTEPVKVEPDTVVVVGRVVGPDGKGLAGYKVTAVDAKAASCGRTKTGEGGAYKIVIANKDTKEAAAPPSKPGEEEAARGIGVRLCVAKGSKEVLRGEIMQVAPGRAAYRELIVDDTTPPATIKKKS